MATRSNIQPSAGRGNRTALSLKGRGLALLAQRDHSRVELKRKLMPHARAMVLAEMAAEAESEQRAQTQSGRSETTLEPPPEPTTEPTTEPASARNRDREHDHAVPPSPAPRDYAGALGAATLDNVKASSAVDRDNVDPPSAAARDNVEPPSAAARVDEVLDWLQARDYLSDARFAESRTHARSAKFGNMRIRHELSQHGVTLTPESAQRLKDSEFERAKELQSRKFGRPPANAHEHAKQSRFLAGRGFSSDAIRQVMRLVGRAPVIELDEGEA